jgi:predicted O-methyltransferase YrrM
VAEAAEKKVVCLGQPSYGQLTAGAARGFYRASEDKLKVHANAIQSSLLAQAFNILWCWMLNRRHNGDPVSYFAMLHADVEPEDWWLDKLVEELEAKGLDVLGAVAPIKDRRGVTSIAMAHDSGDPWRVHGRLTMREVHRLPETFTSEDVGRTILLNTGCWVAKVGDWCNQVHFTINDRIAFDAKRNAYVAECEPEDWFFSRLLHELGLKVGATRKVKLGHRGDTVFVNSHPWGTDSFDEQGLKRSVLDEAVDEGGESDWFPHDAAGWLLEEEGRELARLAAGKAVLEIGSYCGRSTVCLARTARAVTAVDSFDGRGTEMPGDTYRTFLANLERYGVSAKVRAVRGTSAEVLGRLPPVYDLAFIDGSHDRESVVADAGRAALLLRPGGVLVFHDYQTVTDPGVTQAVNELIESGGALLSRCGSVAVVRPPAGAAVVNG